MSKMGSLCQSVDEDIIEMLNADSKKTVEEIDEIIVEMHGSMFRGRAEELLNEMYGGW